VKQPAAAIQDAEDFLSSIINTLADPVFVKDREHRWVALNEAYCRFMGYPLEQLLGKSDVDFFPAAEAAVFWARDDEVFATNAENTNEEDFTDAAGVTHVIVTKKAVFTDRNGARFLVGVIRDVTDLRLAERELRLHRGRLEELVRQRTSELSEANTKLRQEIRERQRAEEALSESERKYRAIFEGAVEGILIARMDGRRFVYANPAICDMLGYSREELCALGVNDVHPQEALPTIIDEFETQARGERHVPVTLPCLRKDGAIFYADVVAAGIVLDGVPCNLGFFIDVSERRRAEADRLRLEAQVRQAQKMEAVGQLAGGIAHDFNNLLAVLSMQIGLLADAPVGDARRAMAADMRATVDRGAALARQLLLFSRRQPMRVEQHDLNAIVNNLTDLLRRLLGERISLVTELGPTPLWLAGDSGMIEQVILNLCVNARDAMPNGGRLVVATREVVLTETGAGPEKFAHLSVADTGGGIEPAVIERVFEPFFTTKPVGAGTGLGLATAHGIVAQHRGFMRAESEVGTGSAFHVYLPLATCAAQPSAPTEQPLTFGRGERILLVEDDSALLAATARSLRDLGYEVETAADADAAMAVWEQDNGGFDLVLSDMVMPGSMSGLVLCRRLCDGAASLRAIVMTGYSLELATADAVANDSIQCLNKPVQLSTLAAAIRKALESRPAPP
jgi:PAS domain S-box-containing protein